jgi:hypothetical protein
MTGNKQINRPLAGLNEGIGKMTYDEKKDLQSLDSIKNKMKQGHRTQLSSLKACLRNATDDGFVGGESGVSLGVFGTDGQIARFCNKMRKLYS